jgi:hypothetical protein
MLVVGFFLSFSLSPTRKISINVGGQRAAASF